MADENPPSTSEGGPPASAGPPPPRVVEYDALTGVPAEFNEHLPPECPEYKKWKAAQEGTAEAVEKLTLKDKDGAEIEKQLPGGKKKVKVKAQVLLSVAQRQKNKSTTTVAGLELFSVKLAEASKLLGKKFACGASVVKTPAGGEQIEMQGDFVQQIPDLLLKNYKAITKDDVFWIDLADGKRKKNFYNPDGGDDGGGEPES